jgi:hypothetical protein
MMQHTPFADAYFPTSSEKGKLGKMDEEQLASLCFWPLRRWMEALGSRPPSKTESPNLKLIIELSLSRVVDADFDYPPAWVVAVAV